ncbi:alpha-1,2-mannosidase, putative [Chitinophaga costaii]|uniref:Alpha-1,2-mannosidase, putative n=1 Tax=Chitinophaga costaii TaxID=1335309 RepID=A0A1C4C8Q3_9BACT|nr:GH92 family glycosyl hydrolase [Chitinophaga costaii]PUZ27187.1 glycoside hydrolase family 92 protein [Chitinophaga costaii]SCC15496.1 alpha-1,2-mannosidase, putative [Chitinophaga costaii]
MIIGFKSRTLLLAGTLAGGITLPAQAQQHAPMKEPAPLLFVDPYIGSGGHGHVFVGASVPYGAVQAGPTNIVKGWDWCSGYHYSDSVVIGFPQTHLSGTGIGDLGDVMIMPYTGTPKTYGNNDADDHGALHTGSRYSHEQETARPGYYSVQLLDYNTKVEITASERVALHRYKFPQGQPAHVLIDLQQGIGWDAPTETYLEQKDAYTLVGYRFSKGWAPDQRLWFAIKSSVPVQQLALYNDRTIASGKSLKAIAVKGILSFANAGNVLLKIGISPVSSENALANINAEIPDWNFEKTVAAANAKWNKELSRINITTKDTVQRSVFYTALYHTMIDPALFNDHNGDYRGTDKKVYHNPGFNNYSVFSLWDIYRSCAPLATLLHPEKVNDFARSLLAIYEQQGKLPVWHLMGNETNCMVGYHAVPLLADAYAKGFRGFSGEEALEAMKKTANNGEFGLNYVVSKGYIPADKEYESVSKGMEYAIDDWCIAQLARQLGKTDDAAYYAKRATYYKNYFDPSIRFVRPKLDNGQFKSPYDPFNSIHEKGDFTEGNGWQYTWLIPQDPAGMIDLMGGDEAFSSKLDSLFHAKGDMGAQASNDISGLIGMYAHGNEPSHHVTYLYAFAGKPWKTAEKVRQVVHEFYTNKIDGLAGNEDCGAMSSWYVWSALGFYPVNPANGVYVLGSPLFDKATVSVGNGKTFTVQTENNSPSNIYIQSITLNGQPYNKSFIRHQDLLKGGLLKIKMGGTPNQTFGQAASSRPTSF